jgi:hypothetical protein
VTSVLAISPNKNFHLIILFFQIAMEHSARLAIIALALPADPHPCHNPFLCKNSLNGALSTE